MDKGYGTTSSKNYFYHQIAVFVKYTTLLYREIMIGRNFSCTRADIRVCLPRRRRRSSRTSISLYKNII